MSSPFPGMDPYLEGELWTTVHAALAVEIARQLAPKIAPRYIARPEKRFIVLAADDADDMAIRTDVGVRTARTSAKTKDSGTLVLEAPLMLQTVIEEKVPHYWVEIRDAKNRKLVTAIEILSPYYKRGQGRVEYLHKRAAVLKSPAHFLEIDLLRRGRRLPMTKKLPDAEYFVFLSRAGHRPLTAVWPMRLSDSLPTVPVPLLHGDPDTALDLQLALTSVYDTLRYDLEINYRAAPDVPFTKAEAALATVFRRSAVK